MVFPLHISVAYIPLVVSHIKKYHILEYFYIDPSFSSRHTQISACILFKNSTFILIFLHKPINKGFRSISRQQPHILWFTLWRTVYWI